MAHNEPSGNQITEIALIAGKENTYIPASFRSTLSSGVRTCAVAVFPAGGGEIARIIKLARNSAIPVEIRETPIPADELLSLNQNIDVSWIPDRIILSPARLNKIRHFSRQNLSLFVEPGVMVSDIQEMAGQEGLFYPGRRGSSCLIGKCVRCTCIRCSRPNCISDYIYALEGVLSSGEITKIGGDGTLDLDKYQLAYILTKGEQSPMLITGIYLKLFSRSKNFTLRREAPGKAFGQKF